MNTDQKKDKVFSVNMIGIGTFLGTPIAGGYMFAKNFIALGEPKKVKSTVAITILGSAILLTVFGLMNFSSQGKALAIGTIALALPLVANYLAKRLQGQKISNYLQNGGEVHAIGKAAGVIVVGMITTNILQTVTASILLQPPAMMIREFGTSKNKIQFYKEEYTDSEITRVSEILIKENYFTDLNTRDAWMFKDGPKNVLVVTVPQDKIYDQKQLDSLSNLRTQVQSIFSDRQLVIDMGTEKDPSDIRRRIE